MNSEKNQNRQSADEDFKRSLSQLEDLLKDQAPLSEADREAQPDQANRFGGNLLDAIPLAQRLGSRLALIAAVAEPRTATAPSKPLHSKTPPQASPEF
ncbi:MAG: hypothetical protein WBA76_16340 [Phormidesmis sp.]